MTFTNELQSILNHYGLGSSNGLDKVLDDFYQGTTEHLKSLYYGFK